ncbi:MAG TPA: SCO family protein [Gemmataceae bacterium]|nr:SCO family protein [Gemmataceae bacterium]
MRTVTAIALVVAHLAAWPAVAGDGLVPKAEIPAEVKDITFANKLGDKVPLDLAFVDENGEPFTLAQGVNGKPTILVLAWYKCPMLCGEVLAGVLDATRQIRDLTCGRDFNIVAVSFDPKEPPGLALAKKRHFVNEYGRKEADYGWKFLTGKKPEIDQLTAAVGFRYEWDPMTKEFNHPAGIVLLTPEGKIARYFAGIEYLDRNYDGQLTTEPTKTLRYSLIEAGEGKIEASFTDKVFLSCFRYNAHTGKYSASVMTLFRLAGLATLLIIAGFYARTSWKLPGGRVLVVGILAYVCLIPVIMFTDFSIDGLPKWAWRAAVPPILVGLWFVGRMVWRSARMTDEAGEPADAREVAGV